MCVRIEAFLRLAAYVTNPKSQSNEMLTTEMMNPTLLYMYRHLGNTFSN